MMKINLIEYFEESVQRCPQKTAVIDRDRTITFSELRGKALVLASAIGCIKRPAAVFLNKSIESVYADLAIIYSGNFYMNLDVRYPAERLKNILDLVCPGVIITNNQYMKSIVSVIPSDVQVINLDGMDFTQQVDESAIFTNLGKLIDTDPLCIINTSGSTGTPKGVVLNHKSFFDFTEWALDTFKFDDNELMGSLSPLVFDIYSFELCMLMAKSSTLVVIPEHLSAFPENIRGTQGYFLVLGTHHYGEHSQYGLTFLHSVARIKDCMVCRRGISYQAVQLLAQDVASDDVCQSVWSYRDYA